MVQSDLRADFNGKTALITGAARGIGKGIALALGREGAMLALNDASETELGTTLNEFRGRGFKCEGFVADISSFEKVDKMISDIISEMERIDILVNNAGIATPTDFLDLTEAEWDRVISVNLKGTFLVTQAVVKHMVQKQSGRIIMMGSIAGKSGGVNTSIPYDVSKAGMIIMARSLARRYSRFGITVNAIAPSFVDTPMLNDLNVAGSKEDLAKLNVIQRLATPEDIANAVIFLASERSSFITGETINVNGGRLMD